MLTAELPALLIIDVRRVVLDLQERNGRRAVDQVRFNNMVDVEPHVEAVAVLVERLPVVKSPGLADVSHMARRTHPSPSTNLVAACCSPMRCVRDGVAFFNAIAFSSR